MGRVWCTCESGKGHETAKASEEMKDSTWKPRKRRELSVRVGRHGERRVQFLAGMSLYTLTPFIPLLIHFGSSSTREKLHSFSYSSRSNILMVMIFLWEHKTKAKQMVGVTGSCWVFTKPNVTVMLWRESQQHMDLPKYVKGHLGCSQLAPNKFALLIVTFTNSSCSNEQSEGTPN